MINQLNIGKLTGHWKLFLVCVIVWTIFWLVVPNDSNTTRSDTNMNTLTLDTEKEIQTVFLGIGLWTKNHTSAGYNYQQFLD